MPFLGDAFSSTVFTLGCCFMSALAMIFFFFFSASGISIIATALSRFPMTSNEEGTSAASPFFSFFARRSWSAIMLFAGHALILPLQSYRMALETGILFGILTMIGFGLNSALVQGVIKKIGKLNAMAYQALISAALLVPAFLLYPAGFYFLPEQILIATGIALLGVLPLFTFYKALEAGKIGVIVPVANSASVFTVMFSVAFLGESLTGIKLASVAAIILGVITVSVKPDDLKKGISAGVPYALVTSVLWGAYYFLLKYPVSAMGPLFTAVVTQAGIGIFAGLVALKQGKLNTRIDMKTATDLLKVSFLVAIGTAAYSVGIVASDVSIVGPLAFAAPVVSVLYARFFLKERLDIHQYLALFLIVAGIIALSF